MTTPPESQPGDLSAPAPEGQPAPSPVPTSAPETREARLARLLVKARALPVTPGVYLMKDADSTIIYVGKALRLPDRVSSYFIPSANLGPRKQPMLDKVIDFDFVECETEWEALLTENRLIKDMKPAPRFNSRLKDDKSFPYLAITQQEDFPRVFITRSPGEVLLAGGKVLGPFVNPRLLREAMTVLQRVFKYRTCSLDIDAGDARNKFFRPCILYNINLCTAPCGDKIGKDAYRADIDRFVKFLNSKRSVMLREMRAEMQAAAANQQYEQAATLRDQIKAIEKLDERAKVSDGYQRESEISYIDPGDGCKSLAEALGMEAPVRCIEAIDIAHLQGNQTVGSKVCFVDGRPFKDEYRRYKIKTVENDDYSAIREVVSRRYRDAGAGNELFPDVVLIDGGIGQLHAALEAFDTLGIKPPMVISLAKKEELIYVQRRPEPLKLSRNNAGLRMCQAIRDEAHRFAQAYHHVLRKKKTLGED